MPDGKKLGGLTRRQALERGGATLASLSVVGGLAACGSDNKKSSTSTSAGGKSSGKALDGMSHYIANILAFEAMNKSFKAAAEQLGGKSRETAWDGDQQKLLSQVQTFPSLGVNGVFSFTGADAVVPQYAKVLTDKNIDYFNLSNWLPWFFPSDPRFNGHYIGSAGGSFAEEGYLIAKVLFERGNGEGDAIYLRGIKGATGDTERNYGIQLAMKEFPNVKVVATAFTDFDTGKAQQALAQLLPAHKNPKFVICMNDGVAVGALAALRAVKNTTALVNGLDGDPPFLKEIAKDERVVGTSAGLIAHSGVLAAVRLYDALNGVKRSPVEDYLLTDSVIVDTPEAATELLNLTSDSTRVWDARKMSQHLQGDKYELPHKIAAADVTNFNWGDKPGVSKAPQPKGFTFPTAYKSALDGGDIDTVNANFDKHYKDAYASVRAKCKTKDTSVLGTFKRLGKV
jgi:ribose transport system substrate-binding protein